jgi:hypothetical protein
MWGNEKLGIDRGQGYGRGIQHHCIERNPICEILDNRCGLSCLDSAMTAASPNAAESHNCQLT